MSDSLDIILSNTRDPFSDTIEETTTSSQTTNEPPTFDRIGQHGVVYKWAKENHDAFVEWWSNTTWVISQAAAGSEGDDLVKRLAFDSAKKSSIVWQDFDQGARCTNGEPCLVCKTCETILTHPNIKSAGTHSMKNHLKSRQCTQGSSSRRQRQHQPQLNLQSIRPVCQD